MTREELEEYRREAIAILVAGLKDRAPATAEAIQEYASNPLKMTAFEYGAVTGISALLQAIDMGSNEDCLSVEARKFFP